VTSTVPQTFTNNSTLTNTVLGTLDIVGKLDMGSNLLTLAGTGATRLSNAATGAGANVLSGGITLNGAAGNSLTIYSTAAGAGAGAGTSAAGAAITLSGTSPVLRLAPSLGATLTGGTTQGIYVKG